MNIHEISQKVGILLSKEKDYKVLMDNAIIIIDNEKIYLGSKKDYTIYDMPVIEIIDFLRSD